MSIEAYKVAVTVSLVENVTRGLMMMARHFRTTDMEAKVLEARLKSIGKLTIAGGALAAAGGFGLAALRAPLDEAIKYRTEMARFASLGFGSKVNTEADRYARAMDTIGTSTRDNMALVGDAMAVFKNLDHAKMAAPLMARMKFANEVLFGHEGGAANDRKLMDMLKVIEFRGGLSSDAEFKKQADYAQKAIAGSRGRVDASALLLALKTGGVALSRRSDAAFYLGAEPLIQEFGGSRYGTGAMSAYNNLVQARGTITAQQELFRLGLLNPGMVQFNKLGKLKKALPGAFVGSSILESEGELALLQKVLLPAFAKHGITGEENIIRELGMILGNRTGSNLFSRIYQQWQAGSLGRQIAANQHALGVQASERAAANTPAGKRLMLEKQLASLQLQIGDQILPAYIRGLEVLLTTLKSINKFAAAHPAIFGAMVKLFAAVSAAALVGGGLLLLTAGFRAFALVMPAIRIGATLLPILASTFGRAALLMRTLWTALAEDAVAVFFRAGFRAIGPFFAAGIQAFAPVLQAAAAFMVSPITLSIAAVAAVGWLIWNNWKEIKGAMFKSWADIKAGWSKLLHGDLLGALASFSSVFIRGWQTILNTLIAGLNKILPSWLAISKLTFADDFAKAHGTDQTVRPRANGQSGGGSIYMDGRKVGEIVSGHQARAAGRPNTGGGNFDWTRAKVPVMLAAPR